VAAADAPPPDLAAASAALCSHQQRQQQQGGSSSSQANGRCLLRLACPQLLVGYQVSSLESNNSVTVTCLKYNNVTYTWTAVMPAAATRFHIAGTCVFSFSPHTRDMTVFNRTQAHRRICFMPAAAAASLSGCRCPPPTCRCGASWGLAQPARPKPWPMPCWHLPAALLWWLHSCGYEAQFWIYVLLPSLCFACLLSSIV
jgi:hypothetical protein